MHPVVKALWLAGAGVILGSIFVSTVFGIYGDWYFSAVLVAAALPITAAVAADAYVRRQKNFKWKIVLCAVMLALLVVRMLWKIFM